MNSNYVPVYTPHTTSPLAASRGWGYGSALDWFPYDSNIMDEISTTSFTYSQDIADNAIQITLGIDLLTNIKLQFPEFFLDCYIEEDHLAKVMERLREFSFSITSNQAFKAYLESPDSSLVQRTSGSTGTVAWKVASESALEDYVFDNGWIYLTIVAPAAASLADLTVSATVVPKFLFDPIYDTKPRTFRYNGLKQPYYLYVRDVNRSVLPSVNNLLTAYDRGKRNFNYGQTYGARQISMNCFIKANSVDEVPYLIEDLANFLDIGETTLRFADAKDRSWKVVLDGSTDISQSLNISDFTLVFTCLETTSYGEEQTGSLEITEDTDFFQIHNGGTAEAHPVMKLTFTEDSPMVNIVGTGDSENITLGYDSSDGAGAETNFNPRPWLFSEFFNNMNNLNQMNGNTTPTWLFDREFVRNTTLQIYKGTLRVNGNKFPKVDRKTMGYKFYGGGVTRVNPKAVDDFALEVAFSTQGNPAYWTDQHQFIVIYDDQMQPFINVAFGYVAKEKKIRFHMATMGSSEDDAEVRIGTGKHGKEWYNFTGKIIIERKDNRWRIQAGQFKSKKRSPMKGSDLQYGTSMMKAVKSTGYRQFPQETWSRKVGAVGILFANIDNRPQLSGWQIHHMKMWEQLDKPANSQEMTLSFNAGDELIVDFEKAQVWLNGTIAPNYVQPSTDWFSLKPGKNTVGLSGFVGTLEYEYTDRYK